MPIDPLFFTMKKFRDRHVRALHLVDAACDEDGPPVVWSERLPYAGENGFWRFNHAAR